MFESVGRGGCAGWHGLTLCVLQLWSRRRSGGETIGRKLLSGHTCFFLHWKAADTRRLALTACFHMSLLLS